MKRDVDIDALPKPTATWSIASYLSSSTMEQATQASRGKKKASKATNSAGRTVTSLPTDTGKCRAAVSPVP